MPFSFIKEAFDIGFNKKKLNEKIKWEHIYDNDIYQLIKKLPKIDLHCHLGGCASINDLVAISGTFSNDINLQKKIGEFFHNKSDNEIKAIFRSLPKEIGSLIFTFPEENIKAKHIANVIQFLEKNRLKSLLDIVYALEIEDSKILNLINDQGLPSKNFTGIGLYRYLRLGDWGGSTLLQTKKAIEKAIECLCKFGQKHNLKYLELRFNPLSYIREGLTPINVIEIIKEAIIKYQKYPDDKSILYINLILIAGKPKSYKGEAQEDFLGEISQLKKIINEFEKPISKTPFNPRIVGLDIAGLEEYFYSRIIFGNTTLFQVTNSFLKSIMKKPIRITVHCGETQPNYKLSPEDIEAWNESVIDATSLLLADRIGHGLNISKNLFSKLKDKIAIELCPSSNCQISQFKNIPWCDSEDNMDLRFYPLENYFKNGLRVTINTDNPAISKTDWTREIFLASELCSNHLTIKQICDLIYISVQSAFLEKDELEYLEDHFNDEIKTVLEHYDIEVQPFSKLYSLLFDNPNLIKQLLNEPNSDYYKINSEIIKSICIKGDFELRRRIAEALPTFFKLDINLFKDIVRILRMDFDELRWKTDNRRRVIEAISISQILEIDKDFVRENLRILDDDEIFVIIAIVELLFEWRQKINEKEADLLFKETVMKITNLNFEKGEIEAINKLWEILALIKSDLNMALKVVEDLKDDPNIILQICLARNVQHFCKKYPDRTLNLMHYFLNNKKDRNIRRPIAKEDSLDCVIRFLINTRTSNKAKSIIEDLFNDENIIISSGLDMIEKIKETDEKFALELLVKILLIKQDREILTRADSILKQIKGEEL